MALVQPNPQRTYIFQAGQAAVGDQVNKELDTVYNVLQGGIGDSYIATNAAISGTKIAAGSIPSSALADQTLSLGTSFVPIGAILDFWSDNTTPTGYQVCDGSLITDNASPMNGLKTPNLTNVFIRGVSNQNVRTTPILGGEDTHTLSTAEIPTHGHGVSDPGHGHSVNDPSHAHTFTRQMEVIPNQNFAGAGFNPITNDGAQIQTNPSYTGISVNGSGTNISIQNTGSGSTHNNIPSYIGLVKIMRIK